ncbi:MAG: hypothetical protein GY856_00120 [bacterium]|nr:hypothetical protein [bacterium]
MIKRQGLFTDDQTYQTSRIISAFGFVGRDGVVKAEIVGAGHRARP